MTKKELINEISQETAVNKKEVAAVVDSMLSVITKELINAGKVQLLGFGNFEVVKRAEKIGKHPVTKEEMVIPAYKAPKFKASKVLKEMVNK